MPTSLTYPPSQMALMPYSVSPRRKDHSLGPKPMKYSGTLTPKHLAGIMCPSSWRATDRPIPIMRTTIPRT